MKKRMVIWVLLAAVVWGCSSLPARPIDLGDLVPGQASTAPQARQNTSSTPASDCQWATVRRVSDGDTIKTEHGTVRLIGIDTPEVDGPHVAAEPFGEESSAFARFHMPQGTRVCLRSFDTDRDKYDRLLRYVQLEDGEDFGALQVSAGLARTYRGMNHPQWGAYRELEKAAQSAQIGMWQR